MKFKSLLILYFISITLVNANRQKVDSLIQELNTHQTEDTIKANLLLDIAYYCNNQDSIFMYLDEGEKLAQKLNFKKGEGNANVRRGLQIGRSGDYVKSTELYYKAEKLFLESGNYNLTLVCYLNAGNNYADLGDYNQANEEYNKALVVADSIHNTSRKVGVLNNIATIYYVQGNYAEANKMFIEATKVLEELGDNDKLAITYGNIGAVYFVQKDIDNAAKYMRKALKLHKASENTKGVGNQYINLGSLYLENDLLEKGIPYVDTALTLFKRINYKNGISDCYNHLGAAHSKLGNLGTAVGYYDKALHIAIETKNIHGQANIYQNQSHLLLKMNQVDKAIALALKSMEISKELEALTFIKSDYMVLSMAYEKKGNSAKALEYYKKYVEIKDSLFNEEKHKQVAELETQYETDKKEQEIALLSKEKELDRLELEKRQAQIARKNTIMYALIFGAVLIVALAFIIYRRYKDKQKSNQLLEKQNEEIARQNQEITDSIQYAKRIQTAILPPNKLVKSYLENSFILYLPKDIVSGDFYWFKQLADNKILFAVVDCTGHGVPGAMMSVIGYNHLNQCVNEFKLTKPADILNKLNELVSETLHQHDDFDVNDGMDLSLVLYDIANKEIEYSGANNPVYIISEGGLTELKANRFAIGSKFKLTNHKFESTTHKLKENDCIYVFSDGYADQFGGQPERRFMKKNFKDLLLKIATLPLDEQHDTLLQSYKDWKGNLEQLDDICIIGVKV